MFSFDFDDEEGILYIRVRGVWTTADIDRFGREASREFAQARRTARALRLIIDKREGGLLSQDMAGPVARAGQRHAHPEDRVAVLVSSSLMKLQGKRLFTDERCQVFVSEGAARTWLKALDHDLKRAG